MYQQLMITPEPFAYSEFEGFGPDQEVGGPPVGAGRNSPAYIRWVQQSLNQVMGLRLAEDGIMGPATRSAIRSFQQKQGLVADGTVGSKTQMALMSALGIISTPASFSPPGEPSKLTQQTVYGWSQYRQRVEDLPLEQKAILKSIGDAIIASEQQGRPVRTVQVYGHADQDTPPNQQREQQMSYERAKQVTNWLKAYVGDPIAAQIAWDIWGFGSTLKYFNNNKHHLYGKTIVDLNFNQSKLKTEDILSNIKLDLDSDSQIIPFIQLRLPISWTTIVNNLKNITLKHPFIMPIFMENDPAHKVKEF